MSLSRPSTTALGAHRQPKATSFNQAPGQWCELKSPWVGGRVCLCVCTHTCACVTNIQTSPFSSYVPEYPQQRMFHSRSEGEKEGNPLMGNSGASCFIKPFYGAIKYLIPLEKPAFCTRANCIALSPAS